MEFFLETINGLKPLKSDSILSTLLVSLSYAYERKRVLGVDPLHKNDFWFVLFKLVNISVKYCLSQNDTLVSGNVGDEKNLHLGRRKK